MSCTWIARTNVVRAQIGAGRKHNIENTNATISEMLVLVLSLCSQCYWNITIKYVYRLYVLFKPFIFYVDVYIVHNKPTSIGWGSFKCSPPGNLDIYNLKT